MNSSIFFAAVLCSHPPLIQHAVGSPFTTDVFIAGSSIDYTCTKGYKLQDKTTEFQIICNLDGEWEGLHLNGCERMS